uniref:Uncharacterized protein n=1 Tax=Rhizophora mucronata TaxID=61149 RepID=A0A2P2ISD0_RHIMU
MGLIDYGIDPRIEAPDMGNEDLNSKLKRPVRFRLCKVSSHTTELLEIVSDDPALHVLFVPGNPGVVWFYKDFLESLFELLGGRASVTAIGHISFTEKVFPCFACIIWYCLNCCSVALIRVKCSVFWSN